MLYDRNFTCRLLKQEVGDSSYSSQPPGYKSVSLPEMALYTVPKSSKGDSSPLEPQVTHKRTRSTAFAEDEYDALIAREYASSHNSLSSLALSPSAIFRGSHSGNDFPSNTSDSDQMQPSITAFITPGPGDMKKKFKLGDVRNMPCERCIRAMGFFTWNGFPCQDVVHFDKGTANKSCFTCVRKAAIDCREVLPEFHDEVNRLIAMFKRQGFTKEVRQEANRIARKFPTRGKSVVSRTETATPTTSPALAAPTTLPPRPQPAPIHDNPTPGQNLASAIALARNVRAMPDLDHGLKEWVVDAIFEYTKRWE